MTPVHLSQRSAVAIGSSFHLSREEENSPSVRFVLGESYKGWGLSQGLSRGLIVLVDGENLVGEGLGIGCPVAMCDGKAIFSRFHSLWKEHSDQLECSFTLDTSLGWGVYRRSPMLSWLVDRAIGLYMKYPFLQSLLPVGSTFRSLLLIRPFWDEIPMKAVVRCQYQIEGNTVEITCHLNGHGRDLPTIYLLNELGADSFYAARSGDRTIKPPAGWEMYSLSCEKWLYDPFRRLYFRIELGKVSEGMAMHLYWGRELTRDLCWAGYGVELIPGQSITSGTCVYRITICRENRI